MSGHLKKLLIITTSALFLLMMNSGASAAEWTFMIYMDGDNNLEKEAINDFMELSEVGSDANVNIVVQLDRIDGYDTDYGDWTGCKRYLVTQGMTPIPENALQDLGEADMGNPVTLTGFIDWATANFPAGRYALVFWNHGNGWRAQRAALLEALKNAGTAEERKAVSLSLEKSRRPGYKAVCWDDTSGSTLSTREVAWALTSAATDMDLIGFDACLMGMVEVAYEIRETGASIMVASEEIEPLDGWPYDLVLGDLQDHPAWSPAELGAAIVSRYHLSYGTGETQSAIDLGRMDTLAGAVDNLAGVLMENWQDDPAAASNAALGVMTEIDMAVIREEHGLAWPGAHGLAIYFPDTADLLFSDYHESVIDFPADTRWEEFLAEYLASMGGSWVETARLQSQEFDIQEHIDLYDFCRKIYDPPEDCPGIYGYRTEDPMTFFEDISGTGIDLLLEDDSYAPVPLPFPFTFYCGEYETIFVGSNGTIHFLDQPMDFSNVCIPGPNISNVDSLIAPLWDDLDPGSGGAVYYEARGSPPHRRMIVQWDRVPHFKSAEGVTFQVILREGSNQIQFDYLDVDFGDISLDNGASATVGLQNHRESGLSHSCNEPSLHNGMSILFSPALLLHDDFSDGSWAGDPDWEEVRGRWRVTPRGRFTSRMRSRNLAAREESAEFTAGRLESAVKLTGKCRGAPNAGLVFGFQDRDNYRLVKLKEGKILLSQRGEFAGEGRGVKALEEREFLPGRWYRLTVDIHGDTGVVDVFIDDEPDPILSYPFRQTPPGKTGYMANRARSLFDDFFLWDETVLPLSRNLDSRPVE
jgi:hypothetical protein